MSSVPRESPSTPSRNAFRPETAEPVGTRRVSVEEGYRRWAPTYDRNQNPLLALEERWLKHLLPPLAGKRVLDLACGTGRWLAWLLSEGASWGVGIDISPAMLAGAREKTGLRSRLVRADCRGIPFAASDFDLAICSFALSHLPQLGNVVREVARVMAPGASVFVSDLHPQAHDQGWRTGFRDSGEAIEIVTWLHSTRELIAAWNAAGFECFRVAELHLGEPERPIFTRAGKAPWFSEARRIPAVLVFHFQRID